MLTAQLLGTAQEFRRLGSALGAARDRADLLPSSTSDTSALLGMQARPLAWGVLQGVGLALRNQHLAHCRMHRGGPMHVRCAVRQPMSMASSQACV